MDNLISKSLALVSVSLAMLCPALAQRPQPPKANVPYVQNSVTVDGVLDEAEWGDAALLRLGMALNRANMDGVPATLIKNPQMTDVRVKYDDKYLYVGIVCFEDQEGYPQAYPRKAGGNLTLDDAVEVVVGLAEPTALEREVFTMGGYEGALGTLAVAADNYYQFTVSAAGATSRSWNERSLPEPGFDAAVSQWDGGWSAELRIGLESFGLSPERMEAIINGDTPLFLNVFRYRSPQMIGWHLPSFGGYAAMPLGEARLLPKGATAIMPTIEPPVEHLRVASGRAQRPPEVAIGYYPLQGAVIGIIDGILPEELRSAERAVLRVSGQPEQTTMLKPQDQVTVLDRQFVIVPIDSGDQPERTAELSFYKAGQSKPFHTISRELNAVTAPEWHGTDAGIEYTQSKVPPPWSKPVVDEAAHSVMLVDKEIRFGKFGLPEQVELIDGVSLLAGGGDVVLVIDGAEVAFNAMPPKVWEDGNSARVEGTALSKDGKFALQTRSHVDFDGFTEVKLRVVDAAGKDISPERVGRISVRLALDSDVGKFVHRILVQDVLELDGFGFQGPAGPLWVGNQRGGVMFSFDTPLFFSEDRRNQVRVVEEDDRVWMEFNFVDDINQFAQGHLFRFFLLPTPTKPMPDQMARPLVTDYKFEMWSDWQGYPDLAKIPELKKWATAVSEGGRIPILYTCQGLAEDAPYFDEFKEDMMIQPRWTFYRRHHNPGKGVPVHATSKRGPEGDLQLWAFQKLANEANISGVLSDGLSVAWSDSNPGNLQGGGRPVDITWDDDTLTQVTGQRNFLKRLRGIFHDTGRPLAMSAHAGGGLDPNTLSFFDYYIEGEQLSRYPSSYQPSLPIYSIGYSGHPWGLRSTFWIKRWVRSEGPFRALTFALLHNNEVRDNTQTQEVLQIIKNTSGGVSPEFIPYWLPAAGDLLESRSGMSKLSLYRTDTQTLAAAGNFGMDADTVTIDFNSLGGVQGSRVEDVLSGKTYELEAGKLSLELEPGRSVALLLPAAAKAASTQHEVQPALSGWELGAGAKAGRLSGGQAAVVLNGSQAGSGKDATATFAAYPFAPNGSAELLVHLTGNLRIGIGSSALVWTHDRGWRIEGFLALDLIGGAATSNELSPLGWPNLGTLYNPQLTTRENGEARFATLRLSMRNGILDATLDNQPLTRGLQWGNREEWGQPLDLSISTWGAHEVSFAPVVLSPDPVALYEGGLGSPRVAGVEPAEAFFYEKVPGSLWEVNLGHSGVSAKIVSFAGGEGLQLGSGREAGVATLEQTLGDNFSAVLRFETLPKRFLVSIGPIVLKYDGRWVLDGPLGGWGHGVGPRTPDKALSPQPKIAEGAPVVMVISMKNGVLDIVVNNELLARDVAFNIPKAGNRFSIRTWAGFNAAFRLESLSSTPVLLYTPLEQKHPIK